ncbi:MAG: hypothetical protein AAF585_25315 [Verrucomicrobiota bacterium]
MEIQRDGARLRDFMGVQDRDYMRDEGGSGWGGGSYGGHGGIRGPVGWFGGGMNAIWALLALNCIVYFSTQDKMEPESALTLQNLMKGKVHLLLTHQFVHGGIGHREG